MAERGRRGPRKADLSLLQEMMSANLPSAASRPKPSAARLPQASRGTSVAAMRAKIEASKSGDAAIQAHMRALLHVNGARRERATTQAHKQDWLRTHRELQRERAELEASRWEELPAPQRRQPSGSAGLSSQAGSAGGLSRSGSAGRGGSGRSGQEGTAAGSPSGRPSISVAHPSISVAPAAPPPAATDGAAYSPAAGGGGTPADAGGDAFGQVRAEEQQADAQRTAWGEQIRAQLGAIRQLSVAAKRGKCPVSPRRAGELISELRGALDQQGRALGAAAAELEKEIARVSSLVNRDASADRGGGGVSNTVAGGGGGGAGGGWCGAATGSDGSVGGGGACPSAGGSAGAGRSAGGGGGARLAAEEGGGVDWGLDVAELACAFVSPPELRTEGEAALLQLLGAQVAEEEDRYRRGRAALVQELAAAGGAGRRGVGRRAEGGGTPRVSGGVAGCDGEEGAGRVGAGSEAATLGECEEDLGLEGWEEVEVGTAYGDGRRGWSLNGPRDGEQAREKSRRESAEGEEAEGHGESASCSGDSICGLEEAGDYFRLPEPTQGDQELTLGKKGEVRGSCASRAESPTTGGGGSSPLGSESGGWGGGWDTRSHAVLRKLAREFGGRTRGALFARCQLELPHLPLSEIDAELDRMGRVRGVRSRMRAHDAAWAARTAALGKLARQMLQEQAVAEGRVQMAAEAKAALGARRGQLADEMAALEKMREVRRAEEEAEAAEAASLAQLVDEARERRSAAERAQKRALIEEYRRGQDQAQRAAAEQRAAGAAARAEEELQLASRNLERVVFRQAQHATRVAERVAAAAHARAVGEEQARRLMAARDRALAAMGDLTDPARLHRPTAASSAAPVPSAELFVTTGYAESTLMKDVRYKLGIALSSAGLAHTEYARSILTHERLNQPRRPDAVVSSVPFSHPI